MWREVFVEGTPVPQGSMVAYNNRIIHAQSRKLKEWREKIQWSLHGVSKIDAGNGIGLELMFVLLRIF